LLVLLINLVPARGFEPLTYRMKRRAPDESVESFRYRYHADEARPLREALAEWCAEHEANLTGAEPRLPPGIETGTPTAGNRCSLSPTLPGMIGPSGQGMLPSP